MSYSQRILQKIRCLESASDILSSGEEKRYDALIDTLRKLSYPEAVDFIDDVVKDAKLKFLLSLGFGGPLADTKLQSHEMAVPVVNLIPTQSQIDLSKSLAHTLKGEKDLSPFFRSPVTVLAPLVIFNGTFIIDGHHRWSQAYCTNPDIDITVINFTGRLSPLQILKAVQATIGSNLGTIPVSTIDGTDMYHASEKQIRSYLENNLSGNAEDNLKSLTGINSRQGIVSYLLKNCQAMIANNTPILNAPDRDIMPQTRKDPHSLSDLETGITKV